MDMIKMNTEQAPDEYRRMEQAIRYLDENQGRQPTLKEAAGRVHMSEFHFQRVFTSWVGISPKRFLQYLTKERARQLLRSPASDGDLLNVSYQSGLSGPGRLHDLFVTTEALTPGEVKRLGDGVRISYGFHLSPLGECLVASTPRGVCWLSFIEAGAGGGTEAALAELRRRWPRAELVQDENAAGAVVNQTFGLEAPSVAQPLHLDLRGSNFQLKVWEALLRIPTGSMVTYGDLAVYIGMPGAARAVGHAVGQNPVPVLVPCHRVIRKTGELGGYHWGLERKRALLGWETYAS